MQNNLRGSLHSIQRAMENIDLDMPKAEKGVAKAARRIRKELQVVVKACKEGRLAALSIIKSKKE